MNIVRLTRQDNLPCERQAKFIQERINSTETNFSNMCISLVSYTEKQASLRDKSDNIAVVLNSYGTSENINKSMRAHLLEVANIINSVGDCRDILVTDLDNKVVKQLCQYEVLCRNARIELKKIFSAKDKEMNRRRNLCKVREKTPNDRLKINRAETDLVKASAEVSRMQKALEEHIDIFEKKKLLDIKSILKNFILSEITFHCQALSRFTDAYNSIKAIKEEEDLEDFRNYLKMPWIQSRLEKVRSTNDGTVNRLPSKVSTKDGSQVQQNTTVETLELSKNIDCRDNASESSSSEADDDIFTSDR